jgi:hypothetical protein
MSKRKIYFRHFYRIWKVGKSQKQKLAFWKKYSPQDYEPDPDAKQLYVYETLHLYRKGLLDRNTDEELPNAQWPSPYQIYIEKFYWERGVSESPSARLRYFRTHFTEHFELNRTDNLSDEKILADCELFLIVSYHEVEIDPNVQLA